MLKTKSKTANKRKRRIDRDIPENWLNVGQATDSKKYPNVSKWELQYFRRNESGVFGGKPRRIKHKNDPAHVRHYVHWRKDVETLNDLPIVKDGSVTIGIRLYRARSGAKKYGISPSAVLSWEIAKLVTQYAAGRPHPVLFFHDANEKPEQPPAAAGNGHTPAPDAETKSPAGETATAVLESKPKKTVADIPLFF